ncbi:hypothetical protein B4110_0339 [Parageobacillus toebii]|uniref:Uncharacterized protein n=1 Tax=Parageobacillus toebii TaxID=153151 RepID=A0A150N6W1_9BACL|nr:hypothetical protein B4110_0339 [Parageobacillus toebii]
MLVSSVIHLYICFYLTYEELKLSRFAVKIPGVCWFLSYL